MPEKFGKLSNGPGLEKVSFHSNPKECSNYRTTAFISYASKEMFKILPSQALTVREP